MEGGCAGEVERGDEGSPVVHGAAKAVDEDGWGPGGVTCVEVVERFVVDDGDGAAVDRLGGIGKGYVGGFGNALDGCVDRIRWTDLVA